MNRIIHRRLIFLLYFTFIVFGYSQSKQVLETYANKILESHGRTYIVAQISVNETRLNLVFNFLRSNSDSVLMGDLIACADAAIQLSKKDSRFSTKIYLYDKGKEFGFIWRRHCEEALKLGSFQEKGAYLVSHIK